MDRADQWNVSFAGAPVLLHAALWVREACDVLPGDPDLPGRLLDPVPSLTVKVDRHLWRQWWHSLLRGPDLHNPFASPWASAPSGLLPTLTEIGDAPLAWAETLSNLRNPFRPPRYQLPVGTAVSRLRREGAVRNQPDTRVYGLAVEGHWVQVEPESSLVVASWSALTRADQWLFDALRDTVRPLAS